MSGFNIVDQPSHPGAVVEVPAESTFPVRIFDDYAATVAWLQG